MFNGIKPAPSLRKFLLKLLIDIFSRRNGYKDGFYGFSLIILMIAYHTSSYLKYKIMKKFNSENPREKF